MSQLERLIREVHRRSLWQVMGIFLAASWGVIEVVDLLTDQVGLPDWTPTMALVLLLLGLPVVLATAFVQEGMPGGEAGSEPGETAGSAQAQDPSEGAAEAPPANLAPGTGSLDRPSTRPSATRRFLTWRNALLGGLGAFTLLGLSLMAYFVMWTSGVGPVGNLVAQGVIEEGERVLLASFADGTGEGLGEVVTEALRVDLGAAEVLRLVEPVEVEPVLARMEMDPGTRLTGEIAREVALREGIGAVLDGEVARAGTGYLITSSLREGSSGRSLAAFRVTADGPDDIIPAIDKLSQDIREKSGESLRRIKGGEELERVTTGSLEALRLFTQAEEAVYRGDQRRALELLDQTVEVDPEFAMAWRRMAAILSNTGVDWPRHDQAATQAYENRERLSERERYLTEAYYYSSIELDTERTVAAYQNVLRLDPDDASALNNLANVYLELENLDRARELYRRAVDGPGTSPPAYSNLVRVHLRQGDFQRVVEVFEEYRAAYPEDVTAPELGFYGHLLGGDVDAAEALVAPLTDDPALPIFVRVRSLQQLGEAAYWRGRLDEGREHHMAAARLAADVNPAYHLSASLQAAEVETWMGDASWGLERLRSLLDEEGLFRAVDPRGRDWVAPTLILLENGSLEEAEALVAEWERLVPESDENRDRLGIILAGALGIESDPLGALQDLRVEEGCADTCWPAWEIATARFGGSVEVQIRAEEGLVERAHNAPHLNTLFGLPARLRLGGLYEEAGDTAAALEAHRRVVGLWSDADARGQERVRQARARIAALGG